MCQSQIWKCWIPNVSTSYFVDWSCKFLNCVKTKFAVECLTCLTNCKFVVGWTSKFLKYPVFLVDAFDYLEMKLCTAKFVILCVCCCFTLFCLCLCMQVKLTALTNCSYHKAWHCHCRVQTDLEVAAFDSALREDADMRRALVAAFRMTEQPKLHLIDTLLHDSQTL